MTDNWEFTEEEENSIFVPQAVQWLGLFATAGGVGLDPWLEEIRSHMPHGLAKKKKKKEEFWTQRPQFKSQDLVLYYL